MNHPIVFRKSESIPLRTPGLPADTIHIWAARLDADGPSEPGTLAILGAQERQRADRFRFDRDRGRFVSSHVFLRRILGAYLGIGPEAVEFDYGAQGKPVLRDGCGHLKLQFSLAHSEGLTVIAIGWEPMGIDVEKVRRIEDCESLARRHFSRREQEALLVLPAELRYRAFYVCWTRREAILKAGGTGLSALCSLHDVEFDLAGGVHRVRMQDEGASKTDWIVADFEPCEDAVGAVAVPQMISTVAATFVDQSDLPAR